MLLEPEIFTVQQTGSAKASCPIAYFELNFIFRPE
jgi:hypothetical protein